MPAKGNYINSQRQGFPVPQGMYPPKSIRSSLNLDLLDSMFQKLQMSSKLFKNNKIEDKVQLQDTFQPKVIKYNSGQEIFMGLRINRPLPKQYNIKSGSKTNSQIQTPKTPTTQKTKSNEAMASSINTNTTIKIPKMNLFKTIPMVDPVSPPVEDKKKCIIIIY